MELAAHYFVSQKVENIELYKPLTPSYMQEQIIQRRKLDKF